MLLLVAACRISFDDRIDAARVDSITVDAAPACVVDLAVGMTHGCLQLVGGELWCWGANDFGQLGLGSVSAPMATPVRPTVLPAATAIEAGDKLTCVIREVDGRAACVGENEDTHLDGMTVGDPALTPLVAQTPPLEYVRAGENFLCGQVGSDIMCWGDGDEGEPGRATAPDTHPPELVIGSPVSGLALGRQHACVKTSDGEIACWGDGRDNRLGGPASDNCPIATDGAGPCDMSMKARVNVPAVPLGVAAGHRHTCVWTATSEVYCFGANDLGQCGRPPSPSELETLVTGIPPVTQVVTARDHSCALDTIGQVWCWGAGTAGQLGGTMNSATPVMVPLGSAAIELASHSLAAFTCARMLDGSAVCWGANSFGQLGRGTISPRGLPDRVGVACP